MSVAQNRIGCFLCALRLTYVGSLTMNFQWAFVENEDKLFYMQMYFVGNPLLNTCFSC
jgi:hypothetical protein